MSNDEGIAAPKSLSRAMAEGRDRGTGERDG